MWPCNKILTASEIWHHHHLAQRLLTTSLLWCIDSTLQQSRFSFCSGVKSGRVWSENEKKEEVCSGGSPLEQTGPRTVSRSGTWPCGGAALALKTTSSVSVSSFQMVGSSSGDAAISVIMSSVSCLLLLFVPLWRAASLLSRVWISLMEPQPRTLRLMWLDPPPFFFFCQILDDLLLFENGDAVNETHGFLDLKKNEWKMETFCSFVFTTATNWEASPTQSQILSIARFLTLYMIVVTCFISWPLSHYLFCSCELCQRQRLRRK